MLALELESVDVGGGAMDRVGAFGVEEEEGGEAPCKLLARVAKPTEAGLKRNTE